MILACFWNLFPSTGLLCPAFMCGFVPSFTAFLCRVLLTSLGALLFSERKQEPEIWGKREGGGIGREGGLQLENIVRENK